MLFSSLNEKYRIRKFAVRLFVCFLSYDKKRTDSKKENLQAQRSLIDKHYASLNQLEHLRDSSISAKHLINPLTPRSDEHVTSPYDIQTLSTKQVMRILKLIR